MIIYLSQLYRVFDSAGVGRTGTFIALDFLTEQGKELGYIDVFGTITTFRSQRVCLVQTLVRLFSILYLQKCLLIDLEDCITVFLGIIHQKSFNHLFQDQYIFVHQALVESLMLPTSALLASKFPETFQGLLQMDTHKKKPKLEIDFEVCSSILTMH